MTARLAHAVLIALGLLGCDAPEDRNARDAGASRSQPSARERFLGDADFRRQMLVASLTRPSNTYSRDRLGSYATADGGWDGLPEWNPRAAPFTRAHADALARGEALELDRGVARIWNGERPADGAWRALGARVFERFPLRADPSIAHALTDAAFAARVGLVPAEDGTYPGLVLFEDVDGVAKLGITCGLCHAATQVDGSVEIGRARRDLDYGRIRMRWHGDTGVALPAELAARMKRWGPGRADITGDDDEDPVAIPDLWRLLELDALTQAGTLQLSGEADPALKREHDLAILAIRQETQIIQAAGERIRPPRELAWALAEFVADLRPPARAKIADPAIARGSRLFADNCKRCHAGEVGSGPPVAATRVGTDPSLADSEARGTGRYRPSPLVDVARAAPYLHDGTVPTLDDLLDPARLSGEYRRGVRGLGPVVGHSFGTNLASEDRLALIAYLRTR